MKTMATMTDYSILNILEALADASIQIKADGIYTDQEGHSHNLTVFNNDYFRHNCLISFRSWKCTLWDDPDVAFPALFASWWNSRKDLYLKQAYAYTLKYNPIENYASREVMTNDITETEHGLQIEHEHGLQIETTPADYKDETTFPTERKTETTPYNTTETTTPNADTTTHSTKGFNSSEFVETEKDVRSGSVTKATTHTGVTKETVSETVTGKETVEHTSQSHEVVENSGTDTDTHSGTDTVTRNYTLTKSGNIGIQTAAEMLQREYDGLKQDLAKRALYEFITRYCYQAEALDV